MTQLGRENRRVIPSSLQGGSACQAQQLTSCEAVRAAQMEASWTRSSLSSSPLLRSFSSLCRRASMLARSSAVSSWQVLVNDRTEWTFTSQVKRYQQVMTALQDLFE